MDLTKTYPRSPYAKLGNLYMLGRTVDKARAKLDGDLGEYLYDCPLDKILFSFLQISAGQLLRIVSEVTEADDIVARIVSAQATLNADDIATFLASSLNARRLIMISDVAGVLDKDNNLISEINSAKAKEMIASGVITQGMLVKINKVINIADKVKGTVLIDGRVGRSLLYELLSDKGSGTLIRA